MCLYPKLIENPKYKANKKNRGVIPPIKDKRITYVPVGCGKCMECERKRRANYLVRLNEDIKEYKNAKFVTLTYSDKSLIELGKDINLKGYDLDNAIASKSIRRFLERWRKKYKKSVRHWLITEIGTKNTERLHLHGLIYTDNIEDISKIWKYGIVTIGKRKYDDGKQISKGSLGYVNESTISYITKYVTKKDKKHENYKPKIYSSRGIGSNYISKYNKEKHKFKNNETIEYYKTTRGLKTGLPIYYRNKIFTEEEREQLWLEKLDKQERFVNGIKINIKENEDKYFKILKEERLKNKRLGYGDNTINWDLKRYENDLRNIKKMERIVKQNENRRKQKTNANIR
jgi:hypothetical protein